MVRTFSAWIWARADVGTEVRTISGWIWARIWARAAATLVPFAIEALGCPSEEALQFLRDLAPADPRERAVVLRAAHFRLPTLIATRQAELLMAAEGASLYGSAPRGAQVGQPRPAPAAVVDLISQSSA